MPFGSLGLCDELIKAVAEQGYTEASPIQKEAIPAMLNGRDLMAIARTGTGKTAGFTLPILQRLSAKPADLMTSVTATVTTESAEPAASSNQIRALVITPTRELTAQVGESVQKYSQYMNIRSAAVFGGVRIESQIAQLKEGVDLLVATPGRLLDLYNQQAVNFDLLEILVLDEADRMLDLGFIDDIRHIQTLLPLQRQNVMFSATLSKEIKSLVEGMLNDPQLIEVTAANSTVDTVVQKIHPLDKERKTKALIHLIKHHKWHQVLVFSKTKRGADSLVNELKNAEIPAESIHANRTQHARTHALADFKSGAVVALVATDIASRGIDVHELPCVVNFDLPFVPEDYVHRIGRTGRAGTSGLAVSLFSEDEYKQLQAIERLIGRKFEREVIPGFEPSVQALIYPSPHDDEEYGNFEADDPKSNKRPRSKKRGRRRGKSSNQNRSR